MALYHMSVKILSRSSGRSAVAAASYRSRSEIHDKRQGLNFDYSNKKDLGYSEILAPEDSPEWVYDRSELWNRVEEREKRKDSQLAREVEVALPRELNPEQQVDLLRDFCNDNFVKHGMIADVNVHQDKNNPHAHIMLTMRKVEGESFGEKERSWNSKARIMKWREEWANVQNIHLAKAGYDIRVDHKSFEDQGVELTPQTKRGITFHAGDIDFERTEEYNEGLLENGTKIIENPEIALDHITKYQSTFTHDDLIEYVRSHSHESQFHEALNAVTKSPEILLVEKNEYDRFSKFTTKSLQNLEAKMLTDAIVMNAQHDHTVADKYINQAVVNCNLSQEQGQVLKQTIEGGNIHAIIGHAGTGKSYTLNAIREAYEAQGYELQGTSLAGVAAEGLENSSGIKSTTIAKKLYDWDKGRNQLNSKTILVVDEAGMVGTRQMQRILEESEKAGAKVILVGDTKQTQAIEAGGAFRGVIENIDTSRLTEVWRQKEEWQREATKLLSGNRNDICKAIDQYDSNGNIHLHKDYKHAASKLLMQYVNDYKEDQTSLMIAHTNDDVSRLNIVARQNLQKNGKLTDNEYKIETSTGTKNFVEGDRVLFTQKEEALKLNNGSFGTIKKINENGSMVVTLDNQTDVAFDTKQYNKFTHGYAATVHKLQGATVDKTYVLASQGFDRHIGYVAMSRHRNSMNLYYSEDKFQNYEDLKRKFSNLGDKELIADYSGQNIADKVLKKLTDKNATFSMEKYEKVAAEIPEDKIKAQEHVKDNVVAVGYDAKGKLKYSTRDMVESELKLFESTRRLSSNKSHVVEQGDIDKATNHKTLDNNQRFVINRVAGGNGLTIVNYEYGTDRKTVAAALKDIYQEKGYVVEGVALSGMGARSFENESGVSSKTVSQTLWEWEKGKNKLNNKSVIMIDNANRVGTRSVENIVSEAEKAGAKVIMFGDDQSLQSIEAGGVYRGLLQHTKTDRVTLGRTNKQDISWEAQGQDLLRGAQKDAEKAVDLYVEHGRIERTDNPAQSVVDDWINQVKNSGFTKNAMLAYTNKDVKKLNSMARSEIYDLGYIDRKNETEVQTNKHGKLKLSGGDRIIFLKKDTATDIKSGTYGTVLEVAKDKLSVRLDGGKLVQVDTKLYGDFNYGYASTVYRGAKGTENAYILSHKRFNKHITQAALSSSNNVKMYHDFKDYSEMKWTLSRPGDKDITADYPMETKAYKITVKVSENSQAAERYVLVKPQINKDAEKKQLNRQAMGFAKYNSIKAGLKSDALKDMTVKVEQVPLEKYHEHENKLNKNKDKEIGRG